MVPNALVKLKRDVECIGHGHGRAEHDMKKRENPERCLKWIVFLLDLRKHVDFPSYVLPRR